LPHSFIKIHRAHKKVYASQRKRNTKREREGEREGEGGRARWGESWRICRRTVPAMFSSIDFRTFRDERKWVKGVGEISPWLWTKLSFPHVARGSKCTSLYARHSFHIIIIFFLPTGWRTKPVSIYHLCRRSTNPIPLQRPCQEGVQN